MYPRLNPNLKDRSGDRVDLDPDRTLQEIIQSHLETELDLDHHLENV